MSDATFHGEKVFVFLGGRLLVIRRDNYAHIPWPGRLDIPGGGREGSETPEDCVLRETREEVGLHLGVRDLGWRRRFEGDGGVSWFFATALPAARVSEIRLGDEGTAWHLIAPDDYLSRQDAIPHFQARLRLCLEGFRPLS